MAERPVLGTLTIAAAAWLALALQGPHSVATLCLSASTSVSDGLAARVEWFWRSGAVSEFALCWVTMTIAMVPPMAVPLVRHVAVRSFTFRRGRSVILFLSGLVAIWLIPGVALLLLLLTLVATPLTTALIAVCGFGIAALWQLTPTKYRALRQCHKSVPLAALGWRADRDCFAFGLARGQDCVTSCWAMMFAAILSGHGFGMALCVQAVAVLERRSREPPIAWLAVALAALGLINLGLSL
jgi:predicted metal-binding membrane protein